MMPGRDFSKASLSFARASWMACWRRLMPWSSNCSLSSLMMASDSRRVRRTIAALCSRALRMKSPFFLASSSFVRATFASSSVTRCWRSRMSALRCSYIIFSFSSSLMTCSNCAWSALTSCCARRIRDSERPRRRLMAKALLAPGLPMSSRYVGRSVLTSNSTQAFSMPSRE